METETTGLQRIYRDYGITIDLACMGLIGPEILGGLMWRESRGGAALTPQGPAGTGDGGHGRGLCQIDDRSWPDFCASEDWKDPAKNIGFAQHLLSSELLYFTSLQKLHSAPYTPLQCAIASYNAGPGAVRNALSRNLSPDLHTAHGNYSVDCLRLAKIYKTIASQNRQTAPTDVTGFGSKPASI